MTRCLKLLGMVSVVCFSGLGNAADPDDWKAQVDRLTMLIVKMPEDVELYSRRGDALFFLGEFAAAAQDYDSMVQLDQELDSGHWRRGIAWFYAGEYEKAANQFERYHSFDNIDRENGIWRYLCQRKAFGIEKAREGLLKYEKDDREPFGDVYRLFQGTIQPDELLKKIRDADISATEREKRLFYAELYVGLNEAVEGRAESARVHFVSASQNKWGEKAGYGPNYMWHVARLHLDLLDKAAETPAKTQ